jgi:hypothetical protein
MSNYSATGKVPLIHTAQTAATAGKRKNQGQARTWLYEKVALFLLLACGISRRVVSRRPFIRPNVSSPMSETSNEVTPSSPPYANSDSGTCSEAQLRTRKLGIGFFRPRRGKGHEVCSILASQKTASAVRPIPPTAKRTCLYHSKPKPAHPPCVGVCVCVSLPPQPPQKRPLHQEACPPPSHYRCESGLAADCVRGVYMLQSTPYNDSLYITICTP